MAFKAKHLISRDYQRQNEQLHARPQGFGRDGKKHAARVLDWALGIRALSILDYGCGAGTLREGLRRLAYRGRIDEYDPAIKSKAKMPAPADLVVCTDVLEHVEPEKLEAVLEHLQTLAGRGLFLTIATRTANNTLPDGRNAHLIVEPIEWWLPKLKGRGWQVTALEDQGGREFWVWLVVAKKGDADESAPNG